MQNKSRRSWVWILLGVALLLYPIVATTWNNHLLTRQAELYGQQVGRIEPPTERARLLAQAREYNDHLVHHAYPPLPDSPGFQEYLDTLNSPLTGGVMARITIPSIGVDLPVFHTTRADVLYAGAGHMFGSDLPVGGEGNNAVITAHTGMVDATMFDHLPMLKDGALVTVNTFGEELHYRVTGRKVVRPDQWQEVSYEEGKDKLTLITCTPYGLNTDRLLVEAERVPNDSPTEAMRGWRPSWWMVLDVCFILLALLILWWMRRKRRKRLD